MKLFTIQWISFTLMMIAISMFLAHQMAPKVVLVSIYWYLLAFMSILSFVSFTVVHYANQKGSEAGINGMMIGIGIKLFLSMILLVIVGKKMHLDKVLFMVNFFSLYFLFSFFEIRAMLRNLRHQNSRKKS